MKLSPPFSAALLGICIPTVCFGLDLQELPDRVPSELDDLRYRAMISRLEENWDEWQKTIEEILAERPGDGYALREIFIRYSDTNTLGELLDALASGDVSGLPVRADFEEADLAFMDGLQFLYRSRFQTAKERLETTLRSRRGWAWAHYYLGQIELDLYLPEEEWQRGLEIGGAGEWNSKHHPMHRPRLAEQTRPPRGSRELDSLLKGNHRPAAWNSSTS